MLVASGRDAECAAGASSALRATSPFASLHRIAQAPRVEWLLDYDGTLVDIETHPSLCAPSAALLGLLDSLAASPGFVVNIVSGRSRSELETWFGHLHAICLHAQHGLWSQKPAAAAAEVGGKAATSREWSSNVKFGLGWVDSVRRIFLEFVARTPGSFIEEKGGYGIAWHYRKADAKQGEIQASELRLHLSHVLSSMPLRILLGRFVIEVLPEGVSKSVVARAIVARAAPGTFFVSAGDDATDDDIFTALHAEKPDDSLTIAVGALPRCASTGVAGPGDLKLFLAAAVGERRAAAAPPTLMAMPS
jgi:trehalose 6-phosphate synthase/phosphatase